MASKKKLKQSINDIAGDLFAECLFCRLYMPGVDPQQADILLTKILEMQADYLDRASRPDGKANPKLVKAYYKKLKESLLKRIGEIGEEITLLSQTKEN